MQLQRQIPIPGDMGGDGGDTEMPYTESEAIGPGGDEAERNESPETEPLEVEQPEREQFVGESEARGELGVSIEVPEVQMELVSSGVVEVAPLQVDDSPLMPR